MDSNAIPITLLGRIYSWLPKIRNGPYVEIEEEIPKNEVDVQIEKVDKEDNRIQEKVAKYNQDIQKLIEKRVFLANEKKRNTFVNQLDLEDAIAAVKKEIRNSGNYVAGTLTASYI